MKKNRIFILLGAVGFGAAAGLWVFSQGEQVVTERVVEKTVLNSAEVLVSESELLPGSTLEEASMAWKQWPTEATPGLITRTERPNALTELSGMLVRMQMVAGEPVRLEKLLDKGSRFMSVMLAPGKRALAIPVEQSGGTTAGGFVLPNDYVDVIRVENAATRVGSSQTILRNIRVLAVGPNVGEKSGEKVILGQTATLELEPDQAEFLVAAMQGASLVLALRGLEESGSKRPDPDPITSMPARAIIRGGVASAF